MIFLLSLLKDLKSVPRTMLYFLITEIAGYNSQDEKAAILETDN